MYFSEMPLCPGLSNPLLNTMIQNTRLDCGLELVHHDASHTRFVEIALSVGVGSRYEPKELSGICHFIEHMLFRGCEALPSSYQLNLAFDRIGDGLNAMTYKEFTLFTTRVPAESAGRAFELLAAVLGRPLFNDIDTEREIILEEILEELDATGRESDVEVISRKKIFGDHALARPVLGRSNTVKKLSIQELRDFHGKFYVPSNMVLAVSGAITWEQTKDLANRAFSQYPEFNQELGSYADGTPLPRAGVHLVKDKASQAQVLLSFFMPGEQTPGELSRLFLTRVLDDGISSRLQRTVCERRGLLYDISCSIESFTDIALFDVQFAVSPQKLVQVVELVLGELRLLKRELVGPDEFSVVRDRFTRDVQEMAESSKQMAALMAEAFLLKLPMPLDSDEYLARINEMTPQAVRATAEQAFAREQCAVTVKGKMSVAQVRDIKSLLKAL